MSVPKSDEVDIVPSGANIGSYRCKEQAQLIFRQVSQVNDSDWLVLQRP